MNSICIPKVTLFSVFPIHCGTQSRESQSKECEYIIEFPLNHFNVFILDLLRYDILDLSGYDILDLSRYDILDLSR